jgi:hypothetical protein
VVVCGGVWWCVVVCGEMWYMHVTPNRKQNDEKTNAGKKDTYKMQKRK